MFYICFGNGFQLLQFVSHDFSHRNEACPPGLGFCDIHVDTTRNPRPYAELDEKRQETMRRKEKLFQEVFEQFVDCGLR
jgi:hypothetical protein